MEASIFHLEKITAVITALSIAIFFEACNLNGNTAQGLEYHNRLNNLKII